MKDTVVITGAGGVLCSCFAKFMAKKGYAVALLDLNEDAAKKVAEEICAEGGIAKGYKANVLDKANLEEVHAQITADLGKCRILINGAGGNSPKATTADETYTKRDEDGVKTFFNLDKDGFGFVFDPIEIHLKAAYKHSLSSLYNPNYYSDYYYRFAYPSNIIISAGVHFQLTKRTGKTKTQLKKEAKELVYGIE